jgi:proteasome lid subunit RPN8/RPN11
MAESNLKEMMIDDINEDADEENQIIDSQPKLKWYLIDTDRTFCKLWNFMITILTIYNLFVVPICLVFPDVYQNKNAAGEYFSDTAG